MPTASPFTTIGQTLPRTDGPLKVTGRATYTAEWPVADLTYGAVVDSGIARGHIRHLELAAARAAPGVLAILTHENAGRLHPMLSQGAGQQITGEGGLAEERQPLQSPEIFYGAQSVALVVAATPEQARYAASLVRVLYDEQVPELDSEQASRQVYPKIFAGTDTLQKDPTKAQAAIDAAPVRVDSEYTTPVYHHNSMELFATIAHWQTQPDGQEHLHLYDTTRGVQLLRDVVAHSFGLPTANVHVINKFLGGAFGSKGWTFFNPLLVAMAARLVGRPVKVEWRRQQLYAVGGQRPATRQTIRLGATPAGKLLGLVQESSTHSSPVCGFLEPNMRVPRMLYDTEIGFTSRLSHLNLPSPCTMRGPGMMAGNWALECAMDELATKLELDPLELRLRNYADVNPDTGQPFGHKHLRECYARGRELFGWDQRPTVPGSRRVGRHLVGYGLATTTHPAVRMAATAQVRLQADGHGLVRTAAHELGNGAYTVLAQIAADGLGLAPGQVRVELGDSQLPPAIPAFGSMNTATLGPAVLGAARQALEELKKVAVADARSPLFGAAPAELEASQGYLQRRDQPTLREAYGTILSRVGRAEVSGEYHAQSGDELHQPAHFSFGAVFAEVRVDEATGVVRVARLCGVFDAGRLVNPRTAYSQLMGGMLYNLGATIMEESRYDPVTGLPVVRNLADYHVPSCADTPEILLETLNIPNPLIGELGAHGVGELGCNGVPAAITNAIFNATGKRLRRLPITPDQLLGD